MNELEFKRHLEALVHGHHHPGEHDWDKPGATKKGTGTEAAKRKARASPGKSKRK